MVELFLAYRDEVGLHSKVILDENPTLIKDLPPQMYDLFYQQKRIGQNISPNKIPGFLLYYCADLEKEGFEFIGKSICEIVSNLEIIAKSSGQRC
jgi:hypothetical protein